MLHVIVICLLAEDRLRKSVKNYTQSIILSKPHSIWISNKTLSRTRIFVLCVEGNWHVTKLSYVRSGYFLLLLQASGEGSLDTTEHIKAVHINNSALDHGRGKVGV